MSHLDRCRSVIRFIIVIFEIATGGTHGMATILTSIHEGPVPILAIDAPADCGAECLFAGRTRGQLHETHGRLLRLDYEMYQPMVQKLLHDMAVDSAARWQCGVVRVVHATGPVALGEASVVIQVLTPHRAASFEACRHLIERLKMELPVWKHEIWERGRTFAPGWVASPSAPVVSDPGHMSRE